MQKLPQKSLKRKVINRAFLKLNNKDKWIEESCFSLRLKYTEVSNVNTVIAQHLNYDLVLVKCEERGSDSGCASAGFSISSC